MGALSDTFRQRTNGFISLRRKHDEYQMVTGLIYSELRVIVLVPLVAILGIPDL